VKIKVDEAFRAWQRNRPELADKLADVVIDLFGVAAMTGSDLQNTVTNKLMTTRSVTGIAPDEVIR
jgi:NTP pyrophosphatase (non-canonical NTP hydrolase)